MASTVAPVAAPLVADLREIFGARLVSVVAYGPCLDGVGDAEVTCLVLVQDLTVTDLDACAHASRGWSRNDIAIPLILREREFRRSLDAFPLEYGEIIRAHERLVGPDPFESIGIEPEDLRRACEVESRSHLVHLREGFIQCGGRPREVAALVAASAPGFAALLRNMARLAGHSVSDKAALTREGARAAGLDEGLVTSVLAVERPGAVAVADPARLFPEYLAAVEQLARWVDQWRA